MKKNIICFTMLLFSAASFCQQKTTAAPAIQTDYLKKSTNQKKTAWILLGGGGALVLTGIIIPKGEIIHESIWGYDYKNDGIKGGFSLTGTLSMLGSIPFFIASGKNKRKAASFSFKNETVPKIFKQNIVSLPLPSLTVKINL